MENEDKLEILAKNVKSRRDEKGWSVRGLAREAKIAHMIVWRLEHCIHCPSAITLGKIARALKTTVDKLMRKA